MLKTISRHRMSSTASPDGEVTSKVSAGREGMLCSLLFSFHLQSGGFLPERKNKSSEAFTLVTQLLKQLQHPNSTIYITLIDLYDTLFLPPYLP